jgi:precorrin-2 dehydrogenase/sirohydrochlorin ferrochelatase
MSEYQTFPVNLIVKNKHCLVVGGGHIATRKVKSLLKSGGIVKVVSLTFTDDLSNMSDLNLTLLTKPFEIADLEGVWLVISATGLKSVDKLVYRECEKRHIWVNSADEIEACNFILPAKAVKSGVTVSVSTYGKSPTFASWLRDYFEILLDDEIVELFQLLADARQVLKENRVPTEKANFKQFVNEHIIDLIKSKNYDLAKSAMQNYVSSLI